MNQKIQTTVIAVAVISLLMISPLLNSNNVLYASGKGLRVIVTVENVPNNVIGDNAQVTIASYNDRTVHSTVIIPDADSFFTELQFAPGEVAVGESFRACVYINENLNECASGVNGEQKAPEYVTISLSNNGDNNQGGDQSSSSSSAANDGSAASSSSSSSKSCLAFC